MNPLEQAILSTVAYRDVFDFPVSAREIHRYLHGIACSAAEVADALASGLLAQRYLESDGEFFSLAGRSALFPIRRERHAISQLQWPLARRFARFLANLPNVRMVALTGSLAAGNFAEDGDIDFLLLTDQGTMWRTRALCRLLALLDKHLARGLFCPNMFLSSAAMTLPRKSLYDAQELCQMIPLYGFAEYRAVRKTNAWTSEFLPNAAGAPAAEPSCDPAFVGIKRATEWLLKSPLGRGLESFEARRKLHRFNETDHLKGVWTRSTPEAHSLWDDMRLKIEEAWKRRLNGIENV